MWPLLSNNYITNALKTGYNQFKNALPQQRSQPSSASGAYNLQGPAYYQNLSQYGTPQEQSAANNWLQRQNTTQNNTQNIGGGYTNTGVNNIVNTPPMSINIPDSVPQDAMSGNSTQNDVFDYRSQIEQSMQSYMANQTSLMNAIQGLLAPSAEEQAAQTALRNFDQSYRLGQEAISNKPIAMPFITGQQAHLQRQAGIERQGLASEYEALSGARTGQLGALKDLYGLQGQLGMDYYNMLSGQQDFQYGQQQDILDGQFQQQKFDEDVRQFGLQYAMQQQKMSQDVIAENQAIAQQNVEALSNVNLINQLIQSDKLGSITGLFKGTLRIGNITGNQEVRNQFNQLKGILSLENRQKLKGSGAISDFEARTLERAASSLGRNLKESDMRKQLIQVRGAILTSHGETAKVRMTDPSTGETQTGLSDSFGIASAIQSGYQVEYVN